MKKFTKICMILAAVIAGAGILLCISSVLLGTDIKTVCRMAQNGELDYGSWNIRPDGIYFGTDDRKTENRENPENPEIVEGIEGDGTSLSYVAADISNLTVSVDAAKLLIQESRDAGLVTVELIRGDLEDYSCTLEEGTLSIIYDNDAKLVLNGRSPEIVVKLPADMYLDQITLETGAAAIQIALPGIHCRTLKGDIGAGSLQAEYIEVEKGMELIIGAGEVDVEDGSYGSLKLECGIGSLEIDGRLYGDLTAECGVGSISLDLLGKESDYNYELSCGLGEIEIGEASYSNMGGSKTITNPGAVGTITLDCGLGSIELDLE